LRDVSEVEQVQLHAIYALSMLPTRHRTARFSKRDYGYVRGHANTNAERRERSARSCNARRKLTRASDVLRPFGFSLHRLWQRTERGVLVASVG
jgi:hypothetical protein